MNLMIHMVQYYARASLCFKPGLYSTCLLVRLSARGEYDVIAVFAEV